MKAVVSTFDRLEIGARFLIGKEEYLKVNIQQAVYSANKSGRAYRIDAMQPVIASERHVGK